MSDFDTGRKVVWLVFKKCQMDGQIGNMALWQLQDLASEELYEWLVGRRLDEDTNVADVLEWS